MMAPGAAQAPQGFLIPLIARRIAILNGHADWQPENHFEVELLNTSLLARPSASCQDTDKDESWRHDEDAAIEVAVSSASLKRMMLYHGSLVKVWLVFLPISENTLNTLQPSNGPYKHSTFSFHGMLNLTAKQFAISGLGSYSFLLSFPFEMSSVSFLTLLVVCARRIENILFASRASTECSTELAERHFKSHVLQVCSASTSGDRNQGHHIARLVALPEADAKDSVAFLSPLLAFNMGFQNHLEAFIRPSEAPKSAVLTSDTAVNNEASGNRETAGGIEAECKVSSRICLSRLDKQADEAQCGRLMQPGRYLESFQGLQELESCRNDRQTDKVATISGPPTHESPALCRPEACVHKEGRRSRPQQGADSYQSCDPPPPDWVTRPCQSLFGKIHTAAKLVRPQMTVENKWHCNVLIHNHHICEGVGNDIFHQGCHLKCPWNGFLIQPPHIISRPPWIYRQQHSHVYVRLRPVHALTPLRDSSCQMKKVLCLQHCGEGRHLGCSLDGAKRWWPAQDHLLQYQRSRHGPRCGLLQGFEREAWFESADDCGCQQDQGHSAGLSPRKVILGILLDYELLPPFLHDVLCNLLGSR